MKAKVLFVVAALCASGCGVKRRAIQSLGDSLSARLSASFASDDDPELVRSAAPFSLKLLESLISDSPRSDSLLLAAAKGFTQYSYAFVQQEAEESEVRARTLELRAEAAKLYLRARDYGLRGLELKHSDFTRQLRADPKQAAAELTTKEVPMMYWTGLAWAGALAASRDILMVRQVPQFEALMERAIQLDEAFNNGAIHTFFIPFEMSSPTRRGNRTERARVHFDWAALAINVNSAPEDRLQNLIYQRRARWLLSRVNKLFGT